MLEKLEERSKHTHVSAYAKAAIHVSLGEKNEAFACLERAYEERCEMITWLKVDPAFDVLHYDLRFSKLLKRVGLNDDSLLERANAS